jgi:hypothetical protein
MNSKAKRKRLDFRQTPGAPLIVLAGLPHPICVGVANSIEQEVVPAARVVFQASGFDPRKLYPAHTVAALIRAVSEFSLRQTTIPAPQHILLAYVPADDDEELLAAFDFFVFPVRLSRLSEYDEHGRQYRHNLTTSARYTVDSIATITVQFLEVKRRLSSPSDKEPLFLPPRNFRTSTSECIADKFRSMRQQQLGWTDLIKDVTRVEVTHSELPRHVRTGATKTVLADTRGLLFPHDPSEHAPARQLEEGAPNVERRDVLKTLFRFGVPLLPGYHHDVQFPGRKLSGQQFECEKKGHVQLRCSYANVYPNDYIRPSET